MFLFARNRVLNPGSMGAGIAAAIEGGAKASDLIGAPIFVWGSVLSSSVGTVTWSMRVDSLEQLMTYGDTINASDEIGAWLTSTEPLFSGPISDVVTQVVHGAPSGPPAPYVSVVVATCANGSFGEGMAMGVEIAEAATRITGNSTMFGMSLFGLYGSVAWLTSLPDMAAVEADFAALAADADWIKLIDRAGHVYTPGATTSLLRRLN